MAAADVNFTVGLDDASIKAIGDQVSAAMKPAMEAIAAALEKALTDGARKGAKRAGTVFSKAWSDAFKVNLNQLERMMNASAKSMAKLYGAEIGKMATATTRQLNTLAQRNEFMMSKQGLEQAKNMTPQQFKALQAGMGRSQSMAWLSGQSLNTAIKAEGIKQAKEIEAAGRLRVAAEKEAGKLQAIAARAGADQATNAQRLAGERRVAITKGVVKTLVSLERGVGTAIAGTARTITAIISRTASGVSSTMKTLSSGIGKLFTKTNHDVTSGLNESLNKRESIYRSSFSQQEQIVRRSVLRQQEQINKLQAASSRGVIGAVTGRGIGGGLAALGGGIAIGAWLKNGYTQAVNLNEQLNKTKVVFGAASQSVVDFAANAVDAFGSTRAEALTAAATFGNLFRAIGLNEDQSAKFSTTLVQLAGDLSSFNNVPIEDAFEAIRSGLVGEQEPLRKFGVNLNDATLKAKALELNLYSGKGVLTASAKAQAAYALILEQTTLAQGDFARTMNEGANAQRRAKKNLEELATTIMATVMPAMTVLFNGASKVFGGMAKILKDQTNPALHLFKQAIFGAAAGMAAVLAAKGAVEVFKLLGVAIKLTLSPLGALLITFGLIGAGVAILMDRSEALRTTMGILGGKIADVGKAIKDKLQPFFDRAGSFIDETLIPAVDRLAQYLADHLIGAIDRTVAFIKNTLIPGLVSFVTIIVTRVVPAVVNVAKIVGGVLVGAFEKVAQFFRNVRPLVQPAIDGFRNLGQAIGSAFGGDFGGLAGGAGAALSGIGASAANIGIRIGEMLAPIAKKIGDWFKDLFSSDKINVYISGVLDFIEMIGYVVARIATHPAFVKALAAVAAAAVVVGFRLVEGIAKGILDNLPGLWDQIVRPVLIAGLKALWHNLPWVVIIGGALVAVVPQLLRAWKSYGKMSAAAMGEGFKSGFATIKGGIGTLFGGVGAANSANDKSAAAALKRQTQEVTNQMRILGVTSKDQLEKTRKGFTDAQLAALTFRDKISQIGTAFSTAGGGFGKIGKGLVDALLAPFKSIGQSKLGPAIAQNLAGLFSSQPAQAAYTTAGQTGARGYFKAFGQTIVASKNTIIGGFQQITGAMSTYAASQGITTGAAWGKAFVGAASVALAAIGGLIAGKAVGESGGGAGAIGLTALTTGLTAGLMTLSPAAGAAGGAMALFGGIIGSASAEAKAAKQRMKEIADTIRGPLVNALKEGTIAVLDMHSALSLTGESGLGDEITGLLSAGTKKKLNDLGLTVEDLVEVFKKGPKAVNALAATLGTKLNGRNIAVFSDESENVLEIYKGVRKTVDEINIDKKFNPSAFAPATTAAQTLWDKVKGIAADSPRVGEAQQAVLADATTAAQVYADALDVAKSAWDTLFNIKGDSPVQEVIDQAIIAVSSIPQQINDALATGGTLGNAQVNEALRGLGTQLEGIIKAGVDQGLIVDENTARYFTQSTLDSVLAGVKDPKIRQQITDEYNAALSQVEPTIKNINTADAAKKAADSAVVTVTNQIDGKKEGVKTAFKRIGVYAMLGLATGFGSSVGNAVQAAADAADKVIRKTKDEFGILSPSKVYKGIGEMITAGLVEGMDRTAGQAAASAANIVQATIDAAVETANGGKAVMNSALAALFGGMTGVGAPGGSTGTGSLSATNALAGITTSISSLQGTLTSNAQAIWDASSKAPGARTPGEQNLVGESATSLNPLDVTGATNLAAVQQSLEQIRQYAMALLSNGSSASDVVSKVQAQISSFVNAAVKLGFKRVDLVKIIDEMGLSLTDLQAFANAAAGIKIPTGDKPGEGTGTDGGGQTSLPTVYPSVGGGVGTKAGSTTTDAREFNMYLSLPSGDPQANALAVANRLAALV